MSDVIVLTQPDCAWCDRAKAVFGSLGAEIGLTVREVDVGSDEGRRLAEQYRLAFVPGVVCEDQLVAYGRASERALRRPRLWRWSRLWSSYGAFRTPPSSCLPRRSAHGKQEAGTKGLGGRLLRRSRSHPSVAAPGPSTPACAAIAQLLGESVGRSGEGYDQRLGALLHFLAVGPGGDETGVEDGQVSDGGAGGSRHGRSLGRG